MKAAILERVNAPLTIADVEVPRLAAGQVLVKMEYSGVCGKQIDEISGRRDDPFLPHLLGHEGAGTIVEVGDGVTKTKKDDRVVLHWMKGPGMNSATPKFRWNGREINAGWVTTFSEMTIASENRVTPIPSGVGGDLACLLGCAVTTGLGIVFNNANLKPGQSLVVFGAGGGVGLNVIRGAALVNAHPIVAVDVSEQKLDWAKAAGATYVVDARRPDLERHLKSLAAQGFDASVDTTGLGAVRQTAYDVTANTGITILAGVPYKSERMTIDSYPLHAGRRIIGSHGGDTRPDVDIPRYLRLHELGKLDLAGQITHRFTLDTINDAIDTVRKGQAGRCVVKLS